MTTTLDKMTIGEAKEADSMFGKLGAASTLEDHGKQIVIVDRGFVFVGDTTTDGSWCRVTNAKNLRYWGTKAGLGELAEKVSAGRDQDGPVWGPQDPHAGSDRYDGSQQGSLQEVLTRRSTDP